MNRHGRHTAAQDSQHQHELPVTPAIKWWFVSQDWVCIGQVWRKDREGGNCVVTLSRKKKIILKINKIHRSSPFFFPGALPHDPSHDLPHSPFQIGEHPSLKEELLTSKGYQFLSGFFMFLSDGFKKPNLIFKWSYAGWPAGWIDDR